MQTHELKRKTKNKKKKTVGRGGTRGKTSGRGTKGQNARAGHKKRPEMRDMIKKLPKRRGRGVSMLKSIQSNKVVLNLVNIDAHFENGSLVTPAILIQKSLIAIKNGQNQKIKLLATGEITKKLNFEGFIFSVTAKEKIEKAGGSIK